VQLAEHEDPMAVPTQVGGQLPLGTVTLGPLEHVVGGAAGTVIACGTNTKTETLVTSCSDTCST
jgi:hypothetical protein